MKNAIVGQSGGPTPVINASLAGVFQAAKQHGIDIVYGMNHGVMGLLKDDLVDIGQFLDSDLKIELLRRTPSSFLGSCRYKLKPYTEDDTEYKIIFENLEKHEIGYFFYIGGNDSMDTIAKLASYGAYVHSPICFIGVPKTIDNDLAITDHCPGYGSAAKYVATVMKEIGRDAACYGTKVVTVVEVMGRNAGWLTAASALARRDDFEGTDLIALPEIPFDLDRFVDKVAELQAKKPAVLVAVSEGIKVADGRYVCELGSSSHASDAFGHKALTGTASYLCSVLQERLGGRGRPIELSVLQRCAGHLTSRTDIEEAEMVGGAAVLAAIAGKTGKTVVLRRISDNPYQVTTDLATCDELANYEKKVPLDWINEDNTDMTQAFLDYATPLIQGELAPFYVNGLPYHLGSFKE